MKKFAKRFISMILILVMLFASVVGSVVYSAEDTDLGNEIAEDYTSENSVLSSGQLSEESQIFPNYPFEDEKYETGPNGFISGVPSSNTRSGLSLDYSVVSIIEGGNMTLSANGSDGRVVDWHSYNTAVATVNSLGKITAVKAGSTTVVASYFDGYGNFVSASCTVHVVIAAEGVCRIQNKNTSLFLNVSGGSVQNNAGTVQAFEENKSNEKYYIRQLWRIKYMGDGYYNIRPYINYQMVLYNNGNNACITTVSYSDDLSNMDSFKWTIEWDGRGYVFKYRGTDYTLQANDYVAGTTVRVAPHVSADNCRWNLISVVDDNKGDNGDELPRGLQLYSASGTPLTSNQTKYTAPEKVMSLNELNFKVLLYASGTPNVIQIYQNSLSWTQGSTSVATVDSVTGAVTGVAEGQTTITARIPLGSTLCSCGYTLTVTAVPEGVYYIRNVYSEKFVSENLSSTTPIEIYQYSFLDSETQLWELELLGNGYYTIKSKNYSNISYYLSVENNSANSGAKVIYTRGITGSGAKWKLVKTEAGKFKFVPQCGETNDRALSINRGTLINTLADGTEIKQMDYLSDICEWKLYSQYFGSLNYWNDDEFSNQIGYWENSPKVYKENMYQRYGFDFDEIVDSSITQWNDALDISISYISTNETEGDADIRFYGGIASDVLPEINVAINENILGATTYEDYEIVGFYEYEDEIVELMKIKKAAIAVVYMETYIESPYSYTLTEHDFIKTSTHELGHALGFRGHVLHSQNNYAIMQQGFLSIYQLTDVDINHLLQVYREHYEG